MSGNPSAYKLMSAMHFLAYCTERPVWTVLVQGNSFKSKPLRKLDAPFARHAGMQPAVSTAAPATDVTHQCNWVTLQLLLCCKQNCNSTSLTPPQRASHSRVTKAVAKQKLASVCDPRLVCSTVLQLRP